jgi:molybdopterin-guanine dinucleotide biosynthesis protein A
MIKITGIILAGGKSSRMGTDKALIDVNGKKLIEYSIAVMKAICHHVIISANDPVYEEFGLPVVADNFKDIGPMAGLEACLRYSKTQVNLVAPCDSPFLNINLFREILKNIEGHEATVPILKDGKVEPLAGCYSKEALPAIIQQIEKGDYKLQNLLKAINTKYIAITDTNCLANINTPQDLGNIKN